MTKLGLTPAISVHIRERSNASAYESQIRNVSQLLWRGDITQIDWFNQMVLIVSVGLTQAWNQAARELGIKPSDFTDEELRALNTAIANQLDNLSSLAAYIDQNSRANKGKWASVSSRVSLWGQAYMSVINLAKSLIGENPKLKWVINPKQENCESCMRLNGKVKRQSQWDEKGYLPRNPPNPSLICGGWRCGCNLETTDDDLSKGPLPDLP